MGFVSCGDVIFVAGVGILFVFDLEFGSVIVSNTVEKIEFILKKKRLKGESIGDEVLLVDMVVKFYSNHTL